jgi:hypothetical protein
MCNDCVCWQMRDALFPALVAIGYIDTPDIDIPDWLSVRCAKDAAKVIAGSGSEDVNFESADVVLRDAVLLAKDILDGDADAARQLLVDRRAQLHMRMDEAIKMHRKERSELAASRGSAMEDRISLSETRTCLTAMRHVLQAARHAGHGEGDCDAHGQPLGLFDAAARVAAMHKTELELALANFDALEAWGYERHLWHDYILRAAPLLAARDAAAAGDLAAVTAVFETRHYADFAIGDTAYHACVPIRVPA